MKVHPTPEQLASEEWLRQKLDEIRATLSELARLAKAAERRGDIGMALLYAREGQAQAAQGYECAGRLHDLTEPVEECPATPGSTRRGAAVGAVEDMLGLEAS